MVLQVPRGLFYHPFPFGRLCQNHPVYICIYNLYYFLSKEDDSLEPEIDLNDNVSPENNEVTGEDLLKLYSNEREDKTQVNNLKLFLRTLITRMEN